MKTQLLNKNLQNPVDMTNTSAERHSLKLNDDDDVPFYNSNASTWTLATSRSTWESKYLLRTWIIFQHRMPSSHRSVSQRQTPRYTSTASWDALSHCLSPEATPDRLPQPNCSSPDSAASACGLQQWFSSGFAPKFKWNISGILCSYKLGFLKQKNKINIRVN